MKQLKCGPMGGHTWAEMFTQFMVYVTKGDTYTEYKVSDVNIGTFKDKIMQISREG